MQHFTDFAAKNGVDLAQRGPCTLCGADVSDGVMGCQRVFELGFSELLGSADPELYRFLIVDAHALQHAELHGTWSNHFHLTRLHLVLRHGRRWSYKASPRLSATLDRRKPELSPLTPPHPKERGAVTVATVRDTASNTAEAQAVVLRWARSVHAAWFASHAEVAPIAEAFLAERHLPRWEVVALDTEA